MNSTAEARLADLTDDVKGQLKAVIQKRQGLGINVNIDWSATVWSLKNVAPDRNQSGRFLNLSFYRREFAMQDGYILGKGRLKRGDPLVPWLETFAKVMCAYYLCEQRKSHQAINSYLSALRWLDQVVREYPVEGLHELLPHHFTKVNARLEKTALNHETKYAICIKLASVAELIDKFALTDQRLKYENPYEIRAWKKKKNKTVPVETMEMLYHCINNPVDDDERILMEFLRLHIAAGNRIGETQLILSDSYFKKNRGTLVELSREYKEAGFDFGLNYLREKADGGIYTKPLDKGAYENVKVAVDALSRLCAPARARAKLLADMPGRFPLPKNPEGTDFYEPSEFITRQYMEEAIGFKDSNQWCKNREIPSYTVREARAKGWVGKAKSSSMRLHLVADVEHACLADIDDLVMAREKDGTPKLWLHDLLCVVFENQLCFSEGMDSRMSRLFPMSIRKRVIQKQLGSESDGNKSIFDRRGMTLPDGSPIKITTHQSRHTRNKFLDEAGLSPIQQAQAMGRDPVQNEWYQGGSDINIIQQSHLSRLQKVELTARTAVVKEAVRARLIEGAITDAYHRLCELSVVKAEEFLDEQVGQVLVTRFGACTNEWSGQSCPKHNKCFKRCKSYHVTGVESERIELYKELSIQRLHRAKIKELADEKSYRADTALHNLDNEIVAIEEAMAQWTRAADRRKELESKKGILGNIPVSVQVYPDGVSHYKEVKRLHGSERVKRA